MVWPSGAALPTRSSRQEPWPQCGQLAFAVVSVPDGRPETVGVWAPEVGLASMEGEAGGGGAGGGEGKVGGERRRSIAWSSRWSGKPRKS